MILVTKFTNIFAKEALDFDWDNYKKTGPDYNGSELYGRLFASHDSHASSHDAAFDVGRGPGQVASALTGKFGWVYSIDPNAYIIEKARGTFTAFPNFSLEVGTAEDIISTNAGWASTPDLISAAESIPRVDIDEAMSAFAKLPLRHAQRVKDEGTP